MRRRFVILIIIVAMLFFLPDPRKIFRNPESTAHSNAFAHFKHFGPSCNVSSLDLYKHQDETCSDRASMLEAMSSGGRGGKDQPYMTPVCDMTWFTTSEVCEILGRFSQVVLVGDSMLRHIIGALNILIREDVGFGAVTDWNFRSDERHECFCLNQFNVKSCSVQGIYKTSDVLRNDKRGLACPKIFPKWKTDLRIEQVNRAPIPLEEAQRLRAVIRSGPKDKPKAFILGQGLWNNLEAETSKTWLDSILVLINSNSRIQDGHARTLLVTPNAAGPQKEEKWWATQGNEALQRFEESMAYEATRRRIDHLGTWNMSIQATLYDGVHMDMRGNLLKAMMVLNWLNLLET